MAGKIILPALVTVAFIGLVAVLLTFQGAEDQPTILTVSAASSLTGAFTEIAREFEAAHPDTKIELNLAGSGTLRMQIEAGAPIDVFASASEDHMNALSEKSLIEKSSRKDFAGNTLVMVVPLKSGSEAPETLEDLTAGNVEKIAIGAPDSAPVGKYADKALEEAGILEKIEGKIIFAENVKQILTYVEAGEADAGFVYLTDAESGNKNLYKIACTVPVSEPISYPIAVIGTSENKNRAQEFTDFVTGARGQEILAKYGFNSS